MKKVETADRKIARYGVLKDLKKLITDKKEKGCKSDKTCSARKRGAERIQAG